jgi:Iap family predicted aminopeptidase
VSTEEKTTDEYIVDFIKAFKTVEDEMEPYKEHKRDLKKNYVDNGWLSKDELRFAIKAYRMLKSDESFEHFSEIYDKISKSIGS